MIVIMVRIAMPLAGVDVDLQRLPVDEAFNVVAAHIEQ